MKYFLAWLEGFATGMGVVAGAGIAVLFAKWWSGS